MNRLVSHLAVMALLFASFPLIAAATRGQETGQVSGWAFAGDRPVPNALVRLRSIGDGHLAASTTCDDAGNFAFVAVSEGTYVVELISPAGAILGTSAPFTLAGHVTAVSGVTVGISPTAAAAAGLLTGTSEGRLSRVGGFFYLLREPFTSALGVTVVAAAAASGVAGVVAARDDTSASR